MPSSREIYGRCLHVAVPSTAEALFQSLISCVDTMMVGVLSAAAISAVGIGSQVKFLLMAVIYALNYTIVTVIARRKGEDDCLSIHRCLGYSLGFAFGLSLLMSVLGYFFSPILLKVLGATSDYLDDAVIFVRYLLIGNIFAALGMAVNSALRGMGNANISLLSNLAANVVNVVMNYCLISGHFFFPALGIKGAAVATVLSNIVFFAISFSYIAMGKGELSFWKIPLFHWNVRDLKAFVTVGSGTLAEQLFTRVGYMTYAAIVAHLGTVAFAVHSICLNLVDITFMLGSGIGGASSVTVGQYLGENKQAAAVMSSTACCRLAMISSLFVAIPFLLFPSQILSLFCSESDVITGGLPVMVILAVCSLLQPQMLVLSGSLRGAGDSLFVALTTLIGLTCIRPVFAWILCYPLGLGLIGAWLGMVSDHAIRMVLNIFRCRGSRWLTIKI